MDIAQAFLQQTQVQMVPIEYVGKKPLKHDTVNYTDTKWAGEGDIQLYPLNLAKRLLVHAEVWRLSSVEEMNKRRNAIDPELMAAAVTVTVSQTEKVDTNGDLTKSTTEDSMTNGELSTEGKKPVETMSRRSLE